MANTVQQFIEIGDFAKMFMHKGLWLALGLWIAIGSALEFTLSTKTFITISALEWC